MKIYSLLPPCLSFLLTVVNAQTDPNDCMNPGGVNGITPECWTALAINQHVTDWWATYNTTCHPGTPFAQCFLQILNMGTEDCIGITSGTCPPPSWTEYQSQNISVKDYYIAYNIYSVRTFFNGYYAAIGNARSAATTSIGAIVALLDPPKKTNGLLNDVLAALSVGLTFIAPEVGPLASAVINGVQQAPNVGKYLFPVGTLDTQATQFDQIANAMGTVTVYLQDNVTEALAAVQNDPVTFLAFTGAGNFSVNPVPTISDQSDAILTALNTYVISQCLQQNNWVIARAIDTDINALQTNGSDPNWSIPGCGNGYSSDSRCGGYYWNQAIDVSFTLTNNGDLSNDPTDAMNQLFGNWTNPDILFNGAAQCQAQGGTVPVVSTGAGGVTASCLSNVKVCTWYALKPTFCESRLINSSHRDLDPSHIGTQYEFIDCDKQSGFAVDGCKGCQDGSACINVPYTYVGNYLTYGGWGMPYDFCIKDGNILTGSGS